MFGRPDLAAARAALWASGNRLVAFEAVRVGRARAVALRLVAPLEDSDWAFGEFQDLAGSLSGEGL